MSDRVAARATIPAPSALTALTVARFFTEDSAAQLGLVSLDYLPRQLLRLRVIAPFAELSREGRRLLMHPGRCAAVLGFSVLTIALALVVYKLIGDGIGSRVSLGVWAMVVPPVTFIQLLPVSLAGWGVREAALVVALGSFGIPAEAALAISILMALCLILTSLPGGLIWIAGWDIARPRLSPTAGSLEAR